MALWNTHACSVECVDEHGSTTIRLCRVYKHLGRIVSVQANMSPEVLARTSAACSKHRAAHQECGSLFLRPEQGFSTSLLPDRSSIALRCARWKAHIEILRALPVDVSVLMVFLPRAPHRCSPKFPSPPLQIAMAAARLQHLPRLLKVAPPLPLPLPYSFSWMRIDHGVMFFVMIVCLSGFKRPMSTKCFHIPTARCSCLGVISPPLPLAVGSTWSKLGRDPMFRRLLGTKIPHNPAGFLYIQTYSYIGLVTSVACPSPRIVL